MTRPFTFGVAIVVLICAHVAAQPAVAPATTEPMARPTGFGTGDPAAAAMAAAQLAPDVWTRSYNNARTGANVHEKRLNPGTLAQPLLSCQ